MKINRFIFKDKSLEWTLDGIDFDNLTLLVGASGVGKTQILKAILAVQRIGNGGSNSGVKWYVDFNTTARNNYVWEGEFEIKGNYFFETEDDDNEKGSKKIKPKILKETLVHNGVGIVRRTSTQTFFQNEKTLKFPQHQSIINVLREERLINPVHEAFKRLVFSDQSDSQSSSLRISPFNVGKIVKKYDNLEKIRNSDENIRIKLFLAFKSAPDVFTKIRERFSEIFPQVTDLKIAPIDFDEDEEVPDFLKEYPFIQIKEKDVPKWIHQGRISSGMFRTLMHLSEVYLCPEGTVFLIDEFENSLGINCIDELTNDIVKSSRQVQFIITSHHPYIINNIDFSHWKLVTRKSGVVKTNPIDKYISGKSKHDKFMQLMQLTQFETGID